MSPWISAVASTICAITERIGPAVREKANKLPVRLRFATVTFRDWEKDDRSDKHTDRQAFSDLYTPPAGATVEDICKALDGEERAAGQRMKAFFERQTCVGGGDEAEDVVGGLEEAMRLSWNKDAKVRYAVLLTDSAPHGSALHDSKVGDDHADDPISRFHAVIDAMAAAKVELVVGQLQKGRLEMFHTLANQRWRDKTKKALPPIVTVADPPGTAPAGGAGAPSPTDGMPPGCRHLHCVFVLDRSGSMSGEWPSVRAAYTQYISTRLHVFQSVADLVTVILFDDTVVTIGAPATKIRDMPAASTWPDANGGTLYRPGLTAAMASLRDTPATHLPVLFFMTDGQPSDGSSGADVVGDIDSMFRAAGRPWKAKIIPFGSSGMNAVLSDMVSRVKYGKAELQRAANTDDLTAAFGGAANLTRVNEAVSALAKTVTAKVGEHLVEAIVHDHL